MDKDFLFSIHFISTIFMTGVIWIVQLVHYPAFQYVEEKKFVDFEKFHTFNISLIVLPMMIIELLSGISIIIFYWSFYYKAGFISNLIILFITWLITFTISVPLHNKLGKGKDVKFINRLTQTNWLRTTAWSVRLILLSFSFYELLKN